jgi:predicted hydrolase (HD superfamily)
MKKTLYAVDELTGFISAVAFVRPSKAVADVTPQSVRKKMKDKAFARAVDREAMLDGAVLLGVDFDEHVAFVIQAMTDNAETLGLAGIPVESNAE